MSKELWLGLVVALTGSRVQLTWMKAVEMIMPVPNCLTTVNTRLLGDMNFQAKMGEKTPEAVSLEPLQGLLEVPTDGAGSQDHE
jgi:hypothetical protein